MKKKINLKERLLIQESLNQVDLSGLVKLTRHIIVMTFAIEGIGAILLSTQFIPEFGLITGIWYSIFHSISAFCNAGFDLMGSTHGAFSSLSFYVNSFTVSVTLSLLIILGGLGFPTIFNIIKEKKFSKFSLHTKIVILTTLILILFGTSFLFLVEYKNPDTIGNLTLKGKLLSSAFQSITARTAGFNTIDLSLMNEASIFVMIILMFIGASPASTGGGIKTTTLAVLLLSTKSFLLGKHDVEIFKKRIDFIIVKKALGIFLIALFLVISGTLFISIIEPNFTLLEIGFEVVSALTTAGLSICGTANLNPLSKIILITYMFIGRVGSMTVFIAFLKHRKNTQSIKYPEGKIIVG
jgi:trk system potassium uptake protein TrkH